MITYSEKTKTFYLQTDHTSYLIRILENRILAHSYYGAKIPEEDLSYYNAFDNLGFSTVIPCGEGSCSPEALLLEYPTAGRGDFRLPAVTAVGKDGTGVNELLYVSHEIQNGKPVLPHMPQLDKNTENVQTLKLLLRDSISGFEAELYYSVFSESDIIARRSVIRNISDAPIQIKAAASASFDIETSDFNMITLQGAWARERYVEKYPLHHGVSTVESRRGASSHEMNPFAAFAAKNADENQGSVYGAALIYSGDFKISAEVDQRDALRVQIGINPETFSWMLQPGKSLETPEALLTYTENGFNGMSQNFHQAARRHLGSFASDRRHPILINSWEAMYFDFDEEKMLAFIQNCRGLGIDTVVMDDGWFGHRDRDDSSLGDWSIYDQKLPEGLGKIIQTCHENGMKFGIWYEPEMVSPDSSLFRAHPDWCIHLPQRRPVQGRHQLVLDMSRKEVVDCIFEQMCALLDRYDISYIKWDMNRNITDNSSAALPPERQGELLHRYILGVYDLMERLQTRYPHIFFEGCSGGGGRFDFGILYYMPQIWTSDDTDAAERLKIQYGTSFVYPPAAMSAHVSACPNHQTGRSTPFETRGAVAQVCSFGYEFDVGKLSEEEKEEIRSQIKKHRTLERMILDGSFYRLRSPFESNFCSWQLVSADRKQSYVLFAFQPVMANPNVQYLKLKGLDETRQYTIPQLGITRSGAVLMRAGLALHQPMTDYPVLTFDLIAE